MTPNRNENRDSTDLNYKSFKAVTASAWLVNGWMTYRELSYFINEDDICFV